MPSPITISLTPTERIAVATVGSVADAMPNLRPKKPGASMGAAPKMAAPTPSPAASLRIGWLACARGRWEDDCTEPVADRVNALETSGTWKARLVDLCMLESDLLGAGSTDRTWCVIRVEPQRHCRRRRLAGWPGNDPAIWSMLQDTRPAILTRCFRGHGESVYRAAAAQPLIPRRRHMRPITIVIAMLTSVVSVGLLATTVLASGSSRTQPISVQDRCDPVTFPLFGAHCNPHDGGTVKFLDLIARIQKDPRKVLEDRDAAGWRFNPDDVNVKTGTTLVVTNAGGEVHTFTNVTQTGFTAGCIDEINGLFGTLLKSSPLCPNFDAVAAATGLAPVGPLPDGLPPLPRTRSFPMDAPGKFKYQCLIHPWMRTVVEVHNS
jgi:plastocyanin